MATGPGTGSAVSWSPDGRLVAKRHDQRERFDREWRVAALVTRQPLPAPLSTPRLVGADRRRRVLTFEAVAGGPLGPKYPEALTDGDVDGLVAIAASTERYRPSGARFLPRFDAVRRVRAAVGDGHLAAADGARLLSVVRDDPPSSYVFAHGDVTARNVVKCDSDGRLVLLDWEWAGWYPRGWELAFLWYTLVDLPGGRAAVEAAVPRRDEAWFWRSALLVQLRHLGLPGLAPGSPFRHRHLAMRDELLARVLA
jgi:hypothetical protein